MDIDQYPLPRPDDIFASLSGGSKFTVLDLLQAYNQLQLDDRSKKLVTINTHHGLYSYNRLPFGVASAPAVFQRTMEQILQGIDGVACYIDNFVITGKTDQEHLDRLEEVLKRLSKHGVRAKKAKSRFFLDSVEFLGHLIDADGILERSLPHLSWFTTILLFPFALQQMLLPTGLALLLSLLCQIVLKD